MIDCSKMRGYRALICMGETEHTEAQRFAYLKKWHDQGLVEITEPAFLRKVINFAHAVAVHNRRGRMKVPDSVAQERLEICQQNTCGLYNAKKKSCKHPKCGCHMPVKVTWAAMECPLELWGTWGQEEPPPG